MGKHKHHKHHKHSKHEKKEAKTAKKEVKQLLKEAGLSKKERKAATKIHQRAIKNMEESTDKSAFTYASILVQLGANRIAKEAIKAYPGKDGQLIAMVPQKFAKTMTLAANVKEEIDKDNPHAFRDATIQLGVDSAFDKVAGSSPVGKAVLGIEFFAPYVEKSLEPIKEEVMNFEKPESFGEYMYQSQTRNAYQEAQPLIAIGKMIGFLREYSREAVKTICADRPNPDIPPAIVRQNTMLNYNRDYLERTVGTNRPIIKEIDRSAQLEARHNMMQNIC